MAKRDLNSSFKKSLTTSRRLLKIYWQNDRKNFIITMIAFLAPGIIPFLNAYIYALMINFVVSVVSGHHHSYGLIYILIFMRIATLFIQDAASTAQIRIREILHTKYPTYFLQLIMNKLTLLDLATIENSDFQTKFENVKSSASYRPTNMILNIFYSTQGLVQLSIAAISVFFLNWIFALIILATALPTFIYQSKTSRKIYDVWSENSPYRKRFTYIFWRLVEPESIKELRLFGVNKHYTKEGAELNEKFTRENISAVNRRFWGGVFTNLINVAGFAAVEVFIILRTLSKKMSIGSLTYFTTALGNYQSGLNALFSSASGVFESTQYVQEIFDLLDMKPTLLNNPNAIKFSSDTAPKIEFKNVSFTYNKKSKNILQDFSLIINPGDKIALVGENGAGKSTIIKLLCRLYDVSSGEILINDINLKDYDIDSWHDHLGVIFQDFLRYEDTFENNIWFGRVKKPKHNENITQAMNQSGADKILTTLKDGSNQMLGTRFSEGTELSTGQWQKIALARGFYRDAPILILDEPTSAIDAKAEHEIFEKVEKITRDKTAIIISHRFSTVRNADRIVVLENGKIIESGTHIQLMKLNKTYANLFTLQAEAYK